MEQVELIVIGGGAAGQRAALTAYARGVRRIRILEARTALPLTDDTSALRERGIVVCLGARVREIDASLTVIAQYEDRRRVFSGRCVILATDHSAQEGLTEPLHLLRDPKTGCAIVDQGRQTEIAGLFVCGRALYPADGTVMSEFEGGLAGAGAAKYLLHKGKGSLGLRLDAGRGIAYAVPQCVTALEELTVSFCRCNGEADGRGVLKDGAGNRLAEVALAAGQREGRLTLSAADLSFVSGRVLRLSAEE